MLLTEKYAPDSIDGMIGNDEKLKQVKRWMLNWTGGNKRRPLLIWGPPGTGKTSSAYALKKEFDLEIVEMNASELRNKKRVVRILGGASLASTLFGKGKMILIDDVDVLAGRKDFGGASAIASILRNSEFPVIVTATNAWDKKLSSIRSECQLLELKRIGRTSIKKHLRKIAEKEGLNVGESFIDSLAGNSGGDVRSALNDLQAVSLFKRDRSEDIFRKVRKIFKAMDYGTVKKEMFGDVDYNIIKLWMDENIPNEYTSPEDLASAYDWLSRGDVFEGRIRFSNWILLKYSIDCETAGIALAKKRRYNRFVKYSFPSYLRAMSLSVTRRAMLKKIGRKIGRVTHTNSIVSREYIPVLRKMAESAPGEISDFYDFNEAEMSFILQKKAVKRRAH